MYVTNSSRIDNETKVDGCDEEENMCIRASRRLPLNLTANYHCWSIKFENMKTMQSRQIDKLEKIQIISNESEFLLVRRSHM